MTQTVYKIESIAVRKKMSKKRDWNPFYSLIFYLQVLSLHTGVSSRADGTRGEPIGANVKIHKKEADVTTAAGADEKSTES